MPDHVVETVESFAVELQEISRGLLDLAKSGDDADRPDLLDAAGMLQKVRQRLDVVAVRRGEGKDLRKE